MTEGRSFTLDPDNPSNVLSFDLMTSGGDTGLFFASNTYNSSLPGTSYSQSGLAGSGALALQLSPGQRIPVRARFNKDRTPSVPVENAWYARRSFPGDLPDGRQPDGSGSAAA
jgi:hypothetical protein